MTFSSPWVYFCFHCHTASLSNKKYRLVRRVDETIKILGLRPTVVSSLFYTCV